MARRKLLGLITAVPEANHVKRVMEGVFTQCDKYGYDVAVFASLAHLGTDYISYEKGETNIYELINFELLDGVIVDSIAFMENNDDKVLNYILEKLIKDCRKPVVSLNLPLGQYPVIHSSDRPVFREMTEHVLDVHNKTNIYFLTGPEGYTISEERVQMFKEVMEERGLPVKAEQIFYGDFWYRSGISLANDIVSGKVSKPEAVICASDHMAIGLANRLVQNGVKVPEDIIILGFEATQEAALNDTTITSFESNEAKTAADAVDFVRQKIESGAEIVPYEIEAGGHMHAGMSCGCDQDFIHSIKNFKESFYYMHRSFEEKDWMDNIDIGILMEGYLIEQLTATEMPDECLKKINEHTFFIKPATKYYLCLKEDWLEHDKVIVSGYPEKMKTVVYVNFTDSAGYCEEQYSEVFETKWMLPQMFEENDEPYAYYFSAVHFQEKMLGYSVLQCSLKEKRKPGIVYRNWLRNINNALEMIQAKTNLRKLSICDAMTGAYNRHGMDMLLEKMLIEAKQGDSLFVSVLDMDRLKYVNDNFGHAEGDFGVKLVCNTAMKILKPGEICVRAGGDEFYILGVGTYGEGDLERRRQEFYDYMRAADRSSGKPYSISASIGCAIAPVNESLNIINIVNEADENMYKSKMERKKQ